MASAYLARYELELKKKYPQERKSAKRRRKKNYNDISNRKINTEMVLFLAVQDSSIGDLVTQSVTE